MEPGWKCDALIRWIARRKGKPGKRNPETERHEPGHQRPPIGFHLPQEGACAFAKPVFDRNRGLLDVVTHEPSASRGNAAAVPVCGGTDIGDVLAISRRVPDDSKPRAIRWFPPLRLFSLRCSAKKKPPEAAFEASARQYRKLEWELRGGK